MQKLILAIDAGTTESGYALMSDKYELILHGKMENGALLEKMYNTKFDTLVVEMVASYGMAVGASVFETCLWIGRYIEAACVKCVPVERVYRKDEKINLCGSMKAKDANIRQALIDRFAKFDFKNGKGTKAHPDYFYGVSKDAWAAIAVAVTAIDREKKLGYYAGT